MGHEFGHEKLDVYRCAIRFVTLADSILQMTTHTVAACDHLLRAAEGIPLNIAHASKSWSAKERISYLGNANGSALECAACLDILVARDVVNIGDVADAKRELQAICSMLIAMQKHAESRVVLEAQAAYGDGQKGFMHESLDVYQTSIRFVKWTHLLCCGVSDRSSLGGCLDKHSTGIALNIAEGNGRFSSTDHVRFLCLAHSATVRSVAALDIAVARHIVSHGEADEGVCLLARIDSMLCAMVRRLGD